MVDWTLCAILQVYRYFSGSNVILKKNMRIQAYIYIYTGEIKQHSKKMVKLYDVDPHLYWEGKIQKD